MESAAAPPALRRTTRGIQSRKISVSDEKVSTRTNSVPNINVQSVCQSRFMVT